MTKTTPWLFGLLLVGVLLTHEARAHFTLSAQPNYSIFWLGSDGTNFSAANPAPAPANLATGGTAFGSSNFPAPAHQINHINDGLYGNANSWLPNPGDGAPFIGVNLGASPASINSIAFGRDNGNNVADACGGQCMDRWGPGSYTLQRTVVANPGVGTPVTGSAASGWETVGTITYNTVDDATVGGAFTPWFRHDFGLTFNGAAVSATGLRILPSSNSFAIDELEINSGAALSEPLRLVGSGGTVDPDNLALQNGATAFASSVLPGFPGTHEIDNLNDGLSGNSNSWIGDGGDDFVGINLGGGEFVIDGIAFARDNGGEPQEFTGRSLGSYVLEYTLAENPDENTPDSEWNLIGGVSYNGVFPDATPHLRHEFEFDPVIATGIRLHVGPNGISGGVAIDELEVFGTRVPEPASVAMWVLLGAAAFAFGWRRRRRHV